VRHLRAGSAINRGIYTGIDLVESTDIKPAAKMAAKKAVKPVAKKAAKKMAKPAARKARRKSGA